MTSKYPYVLCTQLFMLTIDLIFNAFSVLFYGNNMALLMIFILQDTLLIMLSLVLFVSFTATFVFQLGLIHIVMIQFLPTVIISIFYTFLSIFWHYTSLSSTWDDQSINIFMRLPLLIFYIFHKLISCVFYSYYKRTALQISDPKYNSDSAWLRELFIKHMNEKAAKLEARAVTNDN